MIHRFRRGLDIAVDGAPRQTISPGNPVESVALFGGDFPDMRTEMRVEEGARVARGDALFADRKRPEIVVVAPVAGVVERVEIGARRRLDVLRIRREGNAARRFELPAAASRQACVSLIQACGLWPCLVERPFGRMPDSDAVPAAIFITAMDTEPCSADASAVLAVRGEAFSEGLGVLRRLTDGPLFVCQESVADVVEPDARIRVEKFAGVHPAGLPGTHIDRLHPIELGSAVWQIHYQDVIALGTVWASGMLPQSRIVALAGPAAADPRLIESPDGAALNELLRGEARDGPVQAISGSPLSGRVSSHLRRGHWQVSVMPAAAATANSAAGWFTRGVGSRPAPLVPSRALDRSLGPDLPVVALIRALCCGDAETADRLGCRALIEEDMALATYAAGGGQDFGSLLRRTLDVLERQA